jgi:uncharacterized protein (DUF433 family)
MSPKEILADYEDLQKEDILAVLSFATRLTQVKTIQRVVHLTPVETVQEPTE